MTTINEKGQKRVQLDWFHAVAAIVGLLLGTMGTLAALDARYVHQVRFKEESDRQWAMYQKLEADDRQMREERMRQFDKVDARLAAMERTIAQIAYKVGVGTPD